MPQSSGLLAIQMAKSFRALVVDDNEINRKIINVILTEAGAKVRQAQNGSEAYEAVAEHPFDVILMDIQMPVMDGHAAVQAIRSMEAERGLKRTPIIMVSAFTGMEDVDRSMEAGADLHLAKPVQVVSLLTAVRDALEGGLRDEEGRLRLYYS